MERRVNRKWLGFLVGLLLLVTSWIMLCRAVLAAPMTSASLASVPLTGAPMASQPINLAKQPLTTVTVHLGDAAGALRFEPQELTFEAGRRYQLHMVNDSPSKHYFTAKNFADGIWSQKVDTGGVEVKGAIHDIEVRSNAYADWVFVPVRAGHYDLRCVVPGHTEAGMVGDIEILGQLP